MSRWSRVVLGAAILAGTACSGDVGASPSSTTAGSTALSGTGDEGLLVTTVHGEAR